METRLVPVDDGSLFVRSWGVSDGPCRLLLHAAGESSTTWVPIAAELGVEHQVHALDFRGHGASERAAAYSFELMRDDVLGAVAALGLDEVTLIGHSLGGMVGCLIASQRPPWLNRLVLEDAPPPLPLVPARPGPKEPGGDLGFDWQAIVDLYVQRNHPDPSWWDDLERIEVPTLVISGGTTSHVDPHQMAAMAERIPDARLVTIEAEHNVHANRPAEFLTAVTNFL